MTELNFKIHSNTGQVPTQTFRVAIDRAISLLREFDGAISKKRRGVLEWYVQRLQSNGNFSVTFSSRLKLSALRERLPDIAPRVTNTFLTGFEDLEERGVTPPFLSEFGLQTAGDLANLIRGNETTGFSFETGDRHVDITSKTSENVNKLLPIKRFAIGSVEGTLEEINVHRKPRSKDQRFRSAVYHAVTNKAITCLFDDDQLELVKGVLGKRVVVFGQLQKNIKGDTMRIEMDRLEVVENKKRFTLPDVGKLGIPDIEEVHSTAEYMRRIRGG
jgi:hypothetical protein